MSAGNAGAAIGLANTSKQEPIGGYVQDAGVIGEAGPGAEENYAGINGASYYDSNVLGEEAGFEANSNSGAAAGKTAQWVTNSGGVIAAGTTKVAIAGGVATADNTTGTHNIFLVIPTAGIPANSWFWAFLI